jgi:Fuc2NAc and GlcNAc transferase
MANLILVFASFLTVALGTGWVRHIALRRQWLDVPNQRSSHTTPTPRGGGIVIAFSLIVATGVAVLLGVVPTRLGWVIMVGGGGTAIVGWLDDRQGLTAAARIAVHFTCATFAVALLGGLPEVRFGDESVRVGLLGSAAAVVFIVWCLNLYNFMDGIDGLASAEAVCVALVGGAMSMAAPGVGPLSFLVAACALGFLLWNWAPARIFMGDAGSGLLGYVFGVLALASERTGGLPLLLWIILLGIFAFDATVTLTRRVLRGERWYEAHRLHAYQRLVSSGWSHRRVVLGVIGMDAALAGLTVIARVQPSQFGTCLAASALLLFLSYIAVERRYPMYETVRVAD